MQSTPSPESSQGQPRIRAVVELIDDQLKIFPVCDTEDDEQAIIAIRDDGPGIEPDSQVNVFKRFHRIGTGGRGEAALGLGLPLTRQFIEAHGGTVELDSKPGKGTSVTLTIPRAPQ